jgi:hypothetical protein
MITHTHTATITATVEEEEELPKFHKLGLFSHRQAKKKCRKPRLSRCERHWKLSSVLEDLRRPFYLS